MRLTEDRYSRDRQRLDVALRFIENEARTHTIRLWTGLSDDRIRKLYHSYVKAGPARCPARHRGRSPHQAAHFTSTTRLRQESAVLASVGLMLGLLRHDASPPLRRCLPDVRRAQQLCQCYEVYRALVPDAQITFEHAVLLVSALSHDEELGFGRCADCSALVVVDRLSLRAPKCAVCAGVRSVSPSAH